MLKPLLALCVVTGVLWCALAAEKSRGGWAVEFTFSAEGLTQGETLFEYPGVMKAVVRFAGTDDSLRTQDVKRGNYLNFPLSDGRIPVVEFTRTGGHYFAHVSSADLVSWDDHGTAVPNDAWWMTQGTGTPFVRDGKLHLAYGLHTSRLTNDTCTAAMWQDYQTNGTMRTYGFWDLPGFPAGATYASSDDGIRFTPSETLIHSSENPTVYERTDGRLGLASGFVTWERRGLFVSDAIGGWTLFDKDVPFVGDCPCVFEWNGRHYLLQGFSRMAYNSDGRVGGWTDWSQTGNDVYDGLSVPMVATWTDNRRILAAWLNHPQGWGGWLVLRELVQNADGTLGLKWLPEVTPPGDVYEYTCPKGRDLILRIPRQTGGKELEFRVEASAGRAQFADAETGVRVAGQKTQAEHNREGKGVKIASLTSFAIQNIVGLNGDYRVRLNVSYDKKSGCTLFDAEIGGRRTLVCYREGRYQTPVAVGSGKWRVIFPQGRIPLVRL